MGAPSVGSVVLIPFPFSDLSQSKRRPAVVLAYSDRDDWILCQVTSNSYADARAICLTEADFSRGSLMVTSFARPTKLFTANESLFISEAGVLSSSAIKRIKEAVIALFEQSP